MKVNYILSFLKGPALDCFEPRLLKLNEPAWLSDYNLFITEPKVNFSTYDPIAGVEAELEGLHLQENHQATKYFIKFMQLASSGAKQHFYVECIMDSLNISRTVEVCTRQTQLHSMVGV